MSISIFYVWVNDDNASSQLWRTESVHGALNMTINV